MTNFINKNKKYFKNNLFTLVNIAYDDLGGHVRINEPNKVENDDVNFWSASDINNDPYADIVIFGKKTKYGIKISGFGHNSVSDSKKELFRHLTKLLNTKGYFIEASDKPAQILLNRDIPIIHDINIIKEIFGNIANDAKYIDNDNIWYIRTVNHSGDKSKEILFGKPII